MASVINTFDIGQFYAPKATATSESFENMIRALKNKKLNINVAKPNISLDLGPNTSCIMLSPNSEIYENENNYSCVIKVSYKSSIICLWVTLKNSPNRNYLKIIMI